MHAFIERYYRALFSLMLLAIAGLSFYVGILQGRQSKGDQVILSCTTDVLSKLAIPLGVESMASSQISPTNGSAPPPQGQYAGSKNGTKYYTPGCGGLNRIKPENIIWFESAEDATLQGYTKASC